MKCRKLLYILTFFIVFSSQKLQGQYKLNEDSLLQAINTVPDSVKLIHYRTLFFHAQRSDLDRAKEYADAMQAIAQKSGNKSLLAFATNYQGVYYNITHDFPRSLELYERSKALYEEVGNQERVSAILNNMSNSYRNMGDLTKALSLQMQSVKIKEAVGANEEALAASYWNIGNIQSDIDHFEASNQWYWKAQKIYKKLNLEEDVLYLDYLVALNYFHMDSLELSQETFIKVEQYSRTNKQYNQLAGVLDQLGQIEKINKNYDKAEALYLEALALAENNKEASLPGLLYRRLANLYREQNQYTKALKYAKKSLENAEATEVRKKKITDYLVLAEIHEKMGQFEPAFYAYRDYHLLKDSIFSAENLAKINEMEIRYQTEKKEREIQLLEEKTKIARLRQNGLIGGIFGLLLLFGMLYYALRQKLKRNQVEREKVNRELDFKKQELTAFALQLAHKNEVLENIKGEIIEIKSQKVHQTGLQRIANTIDININDAGAWQTFQKRFEAVHKDFAPNVKQRHPSVSANDLRLMALIKMNLSSKEIAHILNISNEGIKKARYRLRKKLNLETSDSLEDCIMTM